MKVMRRVMCWRCDGAGDLTDDDHRQRFCPTCMGMGTISEMTTDPIKEGTDGWYEDPQPARLSDG